MPDRSSKTKQKPQGPPDSNVTAFRVLREAIGEAPKADPEKNPAAVALGRLGGTKGGPARAASLSPKKRAAIAKKAAKARWAKKDSE